MSKKKKSNKKFHVGMNAKSVTYESIVRQNDTCKHYEGSLTLYTEFAAVEHTYNNEMKKKYKPITIYE